MRNGLIGAGIATAVLLGGYAAFSNEESMPVSTEESESFLNLGVGASSGSDKDCADFSTQVEAQLFFEANDPASDPHHLDRDGDGRVCESRP